MTPVPGRPNHFEHVNPTFFPIDDAPTNERIFRDADFNQIRNFHFCLEMNASFQYRGGEVFEFLGDDDIWAFINRKLAVDIGGVHAARAGSVNLDQDAAKLGITVGNHYDLDFFYCERNTGTGAYIARGWVETKGEATAGPLGEPVIVDPSKQLILHRFGYVQKTQ